MSCTYKGGCFNNGQIHPDESCLKCGSFGVWQERERGSCVDGVFYSGTAYIEGVIYRTGTTNPDNECEVSRYGYEWRIRKGGCCLDSVFYKHGSIKPDNPCWECRVTSCPVGWCSGQDGDAHWIHRTFGTPCPEGWCDGEGNCN